jgi:hypothetical protein
VNDMALRPCPHIAAATSAPGERANRPESAEPGCGVLDEMKAFKDPDVSATLHFNRVGLISLGTSGVKRQPLRFYGRPVDSHSRGIKHSALIIQFVFALSAPWGKNLPDPTKTCSNQRRLCCMWTRWVYGSGGPANTASFNSDSGLLRSDAIQGAFYVIRFRAIRVVKRLKPDVLWLYLCHRKLCS